MMVGDPPLHLTYSTGVHGGERWSEVRTALDRYVAAVRRRVAPGRRFGLGLRLGGRAVMDLEHPAAFGELEDWLARHDAYVFTVNGGAYGAFHGRPVKTAAYRPDWLDEERGRYSDRLARLVVALLPPGGSATVDTLGGALRTRVRSRVDDAAIADRLLRHVALLAALYERTGKVVTLALEPEPYCRLETVGETVEFFDRHLYSRTAVARLAGLTGLAVPAAAEAAHRHLGVCLDASHVAVEFEEPATALRALLFAGISVVKIQLSVALRVRAPWERQAREALRPLTTDPALHQVVVRSPERMRRYVDLPLALAAAVVDGEEWRVHAHAPIAANPHGPIGTTRAQLEALLHSLGPAPVVHHFEVETHTWAMPPTTHRRLDVVEAIARELEWATLHLTEVAQTG